MNNASDRFKNLTKQAKDIFNKLQQQSNNFEFQDDLNILFEELASYQTEIEQQTEELEIINEQLEKGRNKFQELYFEAPVAYFTIDSNANILQINTFAQNLLNISKNNTFLSNFIDYISSDDKQKFLEYFELAKKNNELLNFEIKLISQRAKEICTKIQIKCFFDEKNIRFCRLTVTDISKLKQYERKIKKQNEQFELFFSQSLTGFFFMMLDEPIEWNEKTDKNKILDYVFENQRINKINSAMLNQYGAKEEDFIGLTPKDFFKHDLEEGKRVWKQLFDVGSLHVNTNERRFDGTEIIIEGDYICLYDEKGRITGHFGVQQDITETVLAKKQIEKSEKRFKDIILSSNDWVWEVDINGKYTYVSEKIEDILGIKPQDVIGKTPFDLMKTEDVEQIKTYFIDIVKNKQPIIDLENWNYHKNGDLKCFLTNGVPIIENDELIGYRGVDKDITQKKINEQKIKESEFRWKFAIEGNKDGLWDWNIADNTVYFSERWKTMLGYTDEEIKNHLDEWDKRVHPDDKNEVYKNVNNHLEGKTEVYESEHRLMCKDGSYLWILDRGKIITYTKDGKPFRMIGTHTDISERKNNEQKIKKINETLSQEQQLFKQGNVIVFKWNNKTGWPVEYVSSNVKDILEYTDTEIMSPDFEYSKLIHPEDIELVTKEVVDASNNHQTFLEHKPYRLISKSGKEIWVKDFTSIIYNESDEITDYLGYLVDISDIVEANSKIELLSNLVEQSPAYIFITDLKGNIEYVNKAFTKVMGYTFDEVKGKNASVLKSGRVKPGVYNKMWSTIGNGKVWRGEIINKRKNGEELYENVMIAPIFNDKGQVYKYFSIKDDITEKKKIEIALRKSEKKFRFLAENSKDIILKMVLEDESIEYINPSVQKITGYSVHDFYKNPSFFRQILHKDYVHNYDTEINNLRSGVISDNIELKIICKNGTEKWFLARLTLIKDENKKPIEVDGIFTDITKRKLEQEAVVKEGEEKFKTLIENAQVGISLTDLNGNIVGVNKATLDIYGFKENETHKLSTTNFYENIEDRKKMLKTLSAEGRVKNFEVPFIHTSGKKIYCNLNMSYVTVNKEKLILTTHLDITESKVAELALKESEEKFKTLVENAQIGITLSDSNGNIISHNRAALRIYGLDENYKGRIVSLDFYKNIEDREKLLNHLFETGNVENFEAPFIHTSGKIIYCNLNMSFVVVNNEKLVLTTHLDITENKLAEIAIKESEEKFRTFVDNSADAIRLTDESGKIIFVNKAHEKLTGYSENEVIGKNIWDFMYLLTPNINKNAETYSYFNENAVELFKDSDEKPYKSVFEVSIQTKDNKLLDVKESIFKIKTEKGIRLGTLVHDITELKQQQQELKELVATKDKFFSIIAHDLRTPFNALLGFTDLLNKKHTVYDADKRQIIINSVHESAKIAYKLVENLLTWTRAQTGKLVFNPDPYPIKTLIFEAFHSNKNFAEAKHIQLIDNISENFDILVDKQMIDVILRNLISNAIKFSYENSKIIVDVKKNLTSVTLSIQDFGVGIPKHRLESLFKVDKNTTTIGTNNEAGTGLGLILAKEFVDRHSGKIWAESIENKGSVFYIKLPTEQSLSDKHE